MGQARAVAVRVVAVGVDAAGGVRDGGQAAQLVVARVDDEAGGGDEGGELRTVPLWVVIVAERSPVRVGEARQTVAQVVVVGRRATGVGRGEAAAGRRVGEGDVLLRVRVGAGEEPAGVAS